MFYFFSLVNFKQKHIYLRHHQEIIQLIKNKKNQHIGN